MSVFYGCDAPSCLLAKGLHGKLGAMTPARSSPLAVDLRTRDNPAESPVVWLPPIGWVDVVTTAGARLHACSIACRDELIAAIGADPQGPRRECAACGQVLSAGQKKAGGG